MIASLETPAKNPQVKPTFRPEAPREYIDHAIDDLMAWLPDPATLSDADIRGIIGRYTAVLEGNFIYWMTSAFIAVRSTEAKEHIEENLIEEVKDNHPGMLHKFAVAAHAEPTDMDRRAVDRDLENVRAFVGKLNPLKSVLMMAFFEGFLQKFMAFLADIAKRRGSNEMVYTDVHGVCDVAHTAGLFDAFAGELAMAKDAKQENLLEGVTLLRTLMETIIRGK